MLKLRDRQLNNYDPIARHYDALSRLVFHKAQVNAQIHQLALLPAPAKLLIVGGGTGWILDEISKIHPENLAITYVEISAEMISLAKKRNIGNNSIELINAAVEDFTAVGQYDAVHTAFLFDNFAQERVAQVFNKLDNSLKAGGLWFYTDFSYQPGKDKKWKGLLLKLMYGFFRKVTHTEANELTDTIPYFENALYKKLVEKDYYGKFIKAVVYRKHAAG